MASSWNGYRASKAALGGLQNGYVTPRAKQDWAPGDVVSVGFVKGLEVVEKVDGEYRLWNPANGKKYVFIPHMGLSAGWDA